ncbi:hypothetical protein RB195_020598 [Necator americanus]|uniref:Oxidoreductase, short chain dehydrogenase/reductase family protein n=1 Tax=Necator americanus TaxID=51031 RepID=A0ABR1CJW9_NECAM
MSRFDGKVVIVTGSSSGIGAATALLFAIEGARVTVTGRNERGVKETHDKIVEAGAPDDHVHCIIADLTVADDRQRIVEGTVAKWGHLDILVNNAGASITYGKQGFEANEDAYHKTMDINLNSVLQLTNLARPYLIESKGEIVNVSSISGLKFGNVLAPYYAISKAALDQLTRSLAIDLIEHDVRVNGVSPGIVKTNFMTNEGMTKEQSDKVYDFFGKEKSSCPRRKSGEPNEIANVIAFLADRRLSSFIIGQMIVADGGSANVSTSIRNRLNFINILFMKSY